MFYLLSAYKLQKEQMSESTTTIFSKNICTSDIVQYLKLKLNLLITDVSMQTFIGIR